MTMAHHHTCIEKIRTLRNTANQSYDLARRLEQEKSNILQERVEQFDEFRMNLRAQRIEEIERQILNALAGASAMERELARVENSCREQETNNNDILSARATAENELRNIIADPRYYKEHDATLVRRVQMGFKSLYPE